MRDKKHIDRLFQEGFKDFEAKPSDAVWNNIESKLNKKNKKHRVIPIWWRYAGVAALLLLFLTIGGLYFNAENDSPNPIVDTEKDLKNNKNNPLNDSESIAVESINSNENTEHNKTSAKPTQPKSIVPSHASSVATTTKSEAKNNSTAASKNKANANIAHKNDKHSDNNTPLTDKEKAQKLIYNSSGQNNLKIAKSEEDSISEEVAENNNEKGALTIEEALQNNKDLLKEEIAKAQNRWTIAPNAAPVYFNTLGEGSSIDPQFSSNSKTGEINMSYGISASYAVNDKIKIRSGVNKVNLGYNTNDIILYQSVGLSSNSSTLQNINSGSSSGYSVVSSESVDARDLPQTLLASNTTVNQAFGYIEVPLEIQYTLSDKKFGVNVIGGFSSFFLDKNEVYTRAENGPRVFLGEANNINKISYSANFGLGLNYKVSKTFDLNLEPMFKYQFNTFNNTSGNFTPFFIGVYTGFAIKF